MATRQRRPTSDSGQGSARAARRAMGRTARAVDEREPHLTSATAVAAEALRTGVLPSDLRRRQAVSREDELMRAGDPDDDGLANEYVGEDVPGGSTPTPDQNEVDAIGRAYGLQDEDNGALRTSTEVLSRRDKRRTELLPPGRR